MSRPIARSLPAFPALPTAFAAEIRRDRAVYAVVAVYAGAGVAWLASRGDVPTDVYRSYAAIFATLLAGPLWVSLLIGATAAALVADPRAPFSRLRAWLTVGTAARLAAGLPLAGAALVYFGTYTTLKGVIAGLGFHADPVLADLDRWLHLGVDPGTALHGLLPAGLVLPAIDAFYAKAWGLWFYGFMLWTAFSPDQGRLRVRYFLTLFVAWGLLGTVVAALGSSGGPCYYGPITGDGDRFAAMMAAIRDGVPGGTSAAALQDYLWSVQTGGGVGTGAGISAFPSMHLTLVTVNALFAAERSRWFGALAWSLVPITLFGSVYLGWHYAIDGYVSILATIALYVAVRRIRITRDDAS